MAVSISGLEQLQNSGEEAIIDLLESRIENAEMTFMNGLSQAVYGDGSVTGTISGLGALVSTSPTSGTVGGIDRATWQFWQNIKYSASTDGGAPASAANMQHYMNSLWRQLVRGAGKDSPDLIVCDGNYWTNYLESLQAIQRITGSDDVVSAGYPSLKYMMADVVLDGGFQGFSSDPFSAGATANSGIGGAGANTMYMLNTKYLFWRPHSERNMVPLDPDRFSMNQDAMVKLMAWAGNMTLSNAFMQGVLTS